MGNISGMTGRVLASSGGTNLTLPGIPLLALRHPPPRSWPLCMLMCWLLHPSRHMSHLCTSIRSGARPKKCENSVRVSGTRTTQLALGLEAPTRTELLCQGPVRAEQATRLHSCAQP